MASDDTHVTDTVLPDEGSKISTSEASVRSGRADPTPVDSTGGGDESGAPYSWSLTEEAHLENLKENWRRAFGYYYSAQGLAPSEDYPWFASVVKELRDRPCQDNSELKIVEAPKKLKGVRPLHLAVLMEDLEMVQKILETHLAPNDVHIDSVVDWKGTEYAALDFAIVVGESKMVDALLEKNAKVNSADCAGSLQLAVAHAQADKTTNTFKIIESLLQKGIDINDKDQCGYSAFYVAVAKGKTDIVEKLLKWKDKIKFNEKCSGGPPPIQIAHEENFKDIESTLMQFDTVKTYIEAAYRDRQAYVDAANAILVGAALIASVTFASWLQPPLNYTTSYHGSFVEYADVEHISALGSFWVFNTLSFYFAIGTVVFGAHSVIPRRELFITENVQKLSQNLFVTSVLLALSVFFVIIAFGIAGFIVLIPILRYRWYMIAPTILGGIVCVVSIIDLFKSLWKNRPEKFRNRKRSMKETEWVDFWYGIIEEKPLEKKSTHWWGRLPSWI